MLNFLSQAFKKTYRLVLLPLILLAAFYIILIVPIENGDISNAIFEPWGAAIILMIINHIYLEHLFTTPRDGLVNSLNAVILAFALFASNSLKEINFIIILIYLALVFLSGLIFLIFYNKQKKLSGFSKFSAMFGKSKIIFPMIAIFSFTTFNITFDNLIIDFEFNKLLYILLFFVLFLTLTHKEIIEYVKNLPEKFIKFVHAEKIGFIRANLAPNIVLAEFNSNSKIKINDLIIIGNLLLDKEKKPKKENADKIGLILDFIGSKSENNNITARVYLLNEPQRDLNKNKTGLIKINEECTIIKKAGELLGKLSSDKAKYYWNRRKDIVGLVSKSSNIDTLKVEIVRHQQLENAQLVSIVNKYTTRPVRYQIIEAETRRETQEEKRDFGYTELFAFQLGEWKKPRNEDGSEKKDGFHQFSEFPWVPNMNTLVFRWNPTIDDRDVDEADVDTSGHYLVGKIPKTNLPIYLNINDLVSHHTAILGVTGSGKTTLAQKLLDEISATGIFTVCLDITGQYKNESPDFETFLDENTEKKWDTEIEKIKEARKRNGLPYANAQKLSDPQLEEIENTCIATIKLIISERIIQLRTIGKKVIFELKEISNTKLSIDSTQYFIQGLLEYAKSIYENNYNKTPEEKDNFRCCLVLEEAHTLVPENSGAGGDYGASKAVIEKISQIALQGRKYNVGFILISQRTATVKKTVLNQCNTMISFRAYDETSFNFLSSYYGEHYVKEITHLKNDGDSRYIIVAGKAVVADRPIIVEIKKPIVKKTPEPKDKTKEPSFTKLAQEVFGVSEKNETPVSPTKTPEEEDDDFFDNLVADTGSNK